MRTRNQRVNEDLCQRSRKLSETLQQVDKLIQTKSKVIITLRLSIIIQKVWCHVRVVQGPSYLIVLKYILEVANLERK